MTFERFGGNTMAWIKTVLNVSESGTDLDQDINWFGNYL